MSDHWTDGVKVSNRRSAVLARSGTTDPVNPKIAPNIQINKPVSMQVTHDSQVVTEEALDIDLFTDHEKMIMAHRLDRDVDTINMGENAFYSKEGNYISINLPHYDLKGLFKPIFIKETDSYKLIHANVVIEFKRIKIDEDRYCFVIISTQQVIEL